MENGYPIKVNTLILQAVNAKSKLYRLTARLPRNPAHADASQQSRQFVGNPAWTDFRALVSALEEATATTAPTL